MRRAVIVVALATLLNPRVAAAGEVNGETFIDPLDVSGGFMAPLSPLSPRPQTQVHVTPLEFLVLDVDLGDWFGVDTVDDERFFVYQMRVGGSVAFARRFEIGLELVPLHVMHGQGTWELAGETDTVADNDVNFGNMSAHFLGNIISRHGEFPLYLSGAFRLTFPTAGTVNLNVDDSGGSDIDIDTDVWILEPHVLFGITLIDMITLSTRQGVTVILVPEEGGGSGPRHPFRGDNQVHWYMNFSAGVAPLRWFSIVADFSALFCMNEVDYTSFDHDWDSIHPIFAHLGFGAKFYPLPALSIETAFRFGLGDQARETVGKFAFSLKLSWEWDVSIGGVTVIKESKGGGDASGEERGDEG